MVVLDSCLVELGGILAGGGALVGARTRKPYCNFRYCRIGQFNSARLTCRIITL